MKLLGFREGCYIIRLLGLRVHCYSIRLLVGVQSVLVPHKTVCWVSEYSVSVTAEDYVLGFRVVLQHKTNWRTVYMRTVYMCGFSFEG